MVVNNDDTVLCKNGSMIARTKLSKVFGFYDVNADGVLKEQFIRKFFAGIGFV